MFTHLATPAKIKSLNLGWAHMEEMSDCSKADFDMVLGRLRQKGIRLKRLFGTTNPQPGKGWMHDLFTSSKLLHPLSKATSPGSSEPEGCHPREGGDPGQPTNRLEANGLEESPQISALDSRLRGNDNLEDIMITKDDQWPRGVQQVAGNITVDSTVQFRKIIAPTSDNKALSQGFLDSLAESYDPVYYRLNVLGLDTNLAESTVVKDWHPGVNERDTAIYQPDKLIYLSCDFNVDPMCWVLAHYHKKPGEETGYYEFFDEVSLCQTTTIEAAEYLARKYEGHQGGWMITGDATGQNRSAMANSVSNTHYTIIENALSEAGMPNVKKRLFSKNPAVIDRIHTWNRLVKNQQGVSHIVVNPTTCPKLVWNMTEMRYVKAGEKGIIKEPMAYEIQRDGEDKLKYTKHPFDAASYLVCLLDPIKRLKPTLQNARPKTHFRVSHFKASR